MSQAHASAPTRPLVKDASGSARSGMRGNPWLTLIAVAVGVMMVALDGTVVAIANPAIGTDLHASLADLQWVTNGYLLALAVCLVPAGKLGDRYGHKAVFLVGAAGFAATSLVIGFSGNVTMLITFRVLQGVFGALLQPTALGLLRNAFPGEKLNMAIGLWGAAISTATAAGPIVGGLLVEHVNWESVFYINVPVGVVAVLVGLLVLTDAREQRTAGRIDALGVVLLSAAMFCLVFAVIKAPDEGWGSAFTLGFFAAALVLLVAFALWQGRTREPLMPLRLFRNPSFCIGIVLMLLMAFAMFGAMFFVTFYLEGVNQLTPVKTGVRMLPMMIMMVVGSPIAGILITKLGPRLPIIGGVALAASAMFVLSTLDTHAGYGGTAVGLLLLGLGLSPIMVGATDIIVGNAAVELAGVASGIQQSAMQVGGALGTAVLGAVMSAKVASSLPGHWASAGLGDLPHDQMEQIKSTVSQGFAPVPSGTAPDRAALITHASNASFMDGMQLSFTIGGIALACMLVLALFVRPGAKSESVVAVHV